MKRSLFVLTLCALLAPLSTARAQSLDTELELFADLHRVQPAEGGGYVAHNFAQRLGLSFDGRGVTVMPDEGAWSWGLELASVQGTLVTAPSAVAVAEGRSTTSGGTWPSRGM